MRNNRRHFLAVAATGLVSILVNTNVIAGSDDALAERYYDDAVHMLKRGHWYQRAIEKLCYCVKVSPENSKYHSALGCAYASRFATLCEAYLNRDRKTLSPEEADAFLAYAVKQAQHESRDDDTQANDIVKKPPIKTSVNQMILHTIDDNKDSLHSIEGLQNILRLNATNSTAAFSKSVSVAHTNYERRIALTTQVGGIQLLRLCYSGLGRKQMSEAFTHKEITEWEVKAKNVAGQLVKDFPSEADSLLVMGQVLSPLNKTKWEAADSDLQSVYERAAQLAPENSSIIFRLHQIASANNKKQVLAEKYLREFVAIEKGNAYAHFYLAGFLAKKIESNAIEKMATDQKSRGQLESILKIIGKGATCSKYIAPTDCIKPALLLRSSSALFDSEGNPSAISPIEFADLGSLLIRCAKVCTKYDFDLAKRCCYAMVSMGKRIISSLPTRDGLIPDNRPSERMLDFMASLNVRVAYDNLLLICKKGQDQAEYEAIKRERDNFLTPFKRKQKEYLARDFGNAAN